MPETNPRSVPLILLPRGLQKQQLFFFFFCGSVCASVTVCVRDGLRDIFKLNYIFRDMNRRVKQAARLLLESAAFN